MENFYSLLGVAPNATQDEIKKVFRSLAMRYHPDRNAHPRAEIRFKGIQQAYEILSDPALRDEYNQKLNNRIVLEPEAEAYALWSALFKLQGVDLHRESADS